MSCRSCPTATSAAAATRIEVPHERSNMSDKPQTHTTSNVLTTTNKKKPAAKQTTIDQRPAHTTTKAFQPTATKTNASPPMTTERAHAARDQKCDVGDGHDTPTPVGLGRRHNQITAGHRRSHRVAFHLNRQNRVVGNGDEHGQVPASNVGSSRSPGRATVDIWSNAHVARGQWAAPSTTLSGRDTWSPPLPPAGDRLRDLESRRRSTAPHFHRLF